MISPAEVREAWSMVDVLELCDVDYDDMGQEEFKIFSFINEEQTPSCHIYRDHWYDYSAGQGGDVISFVMQYQGCSFGYAMRLLERGVGDPMDWRKPKVRAKEKPPPENLYSRLLLETADLLDLKESNWDLLASKIYDKWGLSIETLRSWGVRVSSGLALWAPHWQPHEQTPIVHGIKVRDIFSGQKWSVKPSTYDTLYRNGPMGDGWSEPLILCEGESDCWAMSEMMGPGYAVVGLPSGAGNVKPEWFADYALDRMWHVCLDPDDAGGRGLEKVQTILNGSGALLHIVPPPPAKDIADAYRKGIVLTSEFEWR